MQTQEPLGPQFGATRAVARRDDPATSHDAAASVLDLTNKQRAVLEVMQGAQHLGGYGIIVHNTGVDHIRFYGMTDLDIANVYADVQAGLARIIRPSGSYVDLPNQSLSGLRTRRAELVARGLVRDFGEPRKTRLSGGGLSKPMTVWTLK